MSTGAFQLKPHEVVEQISRDLSTGGSNLTLYLDAYTHPDFQTGMMMVSDPVDRAVVVFVGSREEAAKVHQAAQEAVNP